MSERTAPPAGHAELRSLLPWLANGSLGDDERAAVEGHLAGCAACREELELCRRLAEEAKRAEEEAPAPHPVQLERLLERLDRPVAEADEKDDADEADAEGAPAAGPFRSRARWPRAARWTIAAQLAAMLLLAVLAGLAARPASPPAFRTLADPPAPPSEPMAAEAGALRLRVVFDPALSEARLRELLRSVGAEIVGGPSPTGVYTLALEERPDEPVGWRVEHLRAQPGVRFVELAAGGAAP